MKIGLKGIDGLEDEEKNSVKQVMIADLSKLERGIVLELADVHIKIYNEEGNRKKYSVHLRVSISEKVFEANAHDWDLRKALHMVVDKLANELEKRFHLSDKHKHNKDKKYGSTLGYQEETQ